MFTSDGYEYFFPCNLFESRLNPNPGLNFNRRFVALFKNQLGLNSS